jgi:hypothetical protein
LKIINKVQYNNTKRNLIEILANLVLYTKGKTKGRVLKKILKNLKTIETFVERFKLLFKKEKGKEERKITKKENSLQERINISLIVLEAKAYKKLVELRIGKLVGKSKLIK